jgi:protein-disulfide isomerase
MLFKKFFQFQGDIANWLILFTLLIQIFLIITLTQRIKNLEKLFSAPGSESEIVERIPNEQGHIIGAANAPVTIVGFSDFECPYCAAAELTVKQVISKCPDKIRFVYRHFPLTGIHPYAMQSRLQASAPMIKVSFGRCATHV